MKRKKLYAIGAVIALLAALVVALGSPASGSPSPTPSVVSATTDQTVTATVILTSQNRVLTTVKKGDVEIANTDAPAGATTGVDPPANVDDSVESSTWVQPPEDLNSDVASGTSAQIQARQEAYLNPTPANVVLNQQLNPYTVIERKTYTLNATTGGWSLQPGFSSAATAKAVAASITPNPSLVSTTSGIITSDGCVTSYSGAYARGCYTRTKGPSSSTRNYSIDASQAYGSGVGDWYQKQLMTRSLYNNGDNHVVRANPLADVPGKNCDSMSFGLTYGVGPLAASVNITTPVCNDLFSVITTEHYYRVGCWCWVFAGHSVAAAGSDLISVNRSQSSGFTYKVTQKACIGVFGPQFCHYATTK